MENFAGIGRNMMISDKYFKLYLRDSLLPYGLNASEGIVLLMMYQSNSSMDIEKNPGWHPVPNTQDELIQKIHYDKGVMTRTMKDLESKGFVTRTVNPEDSRSFLFALTKKSLEFKDTLISILKTWHNRLLSGLTDEELATVARVLGIMAKNSTSFYLDASMQVQKYKKEVVK